MRVDGGDFSELRRILAVHPRFRTLQIPGDGRPHMSWLGWIIQEMRFLRFGAQFAGDLTLLGFSFQVERDSRCTFCFQWRCPELRPEWRVFLHFLDPHGEIRFNGDHSFGRSFPGPFGLVYLRRTLTAPPDVPEGPYRIRLGVWVPERQEHLPLLRYRGCEREAPGWCHNAVLVGTIQIQRAAAGRPMLTAERPPAGVLPGKL